MSPELSWEVMDSYGEEVITTGPCFIVISGAIMSPHGHRKF